MYLNKMKNYKIKNILVPFDFTNCSMNALKVADKFAADFNSKVHLLNIIEPTIYQKTGQLNSDQLNDLDKYIENSTKAIERYLTKTSINPEAYSYSVDFGFSCDAIINHISNNNYDLIVVPENTKNHLKKYVSKYNPLKIMESTHTPLIAVNKFYRIVDFKNIILPIRNMANWYDKFPFMISLVKQTGGTIHAVGINENRYGSNLQFTNIFNKAISILEQENVLSSIEVFNGENSINELKTYAEKQKADLIAITPPQKNNFAKPFMFHPLFNRLISNSPAPIFGVLSA